MKKKFISLKVIVIASNVIVYSTSLQDWNYLNILTECVFNVQVLS